MSNYLRVPLLLEVGNDGLANEISITNHVKNLNKRIEKKIMPTCIDESSLSIIHLSLSLPLQCLTLSAA